MVSSAIWKNMHEWVFQKLSKLHESEGRVQLEDFQKTHECFFLLFFFLPVFSQIARETILLLINNIHEKLCRHVQKSHLEIKKLRKLRNLKNKKLRKFRKFALYFSFCTVFHFFALYFEKIALLLVNQNWEIFHVYYYWQWINIFVTILIPISCCAGVKNKHFWFFSCISLLRIQDSGQMDNWSALFSKQYRIKS
jgi:hypothetical protein